MTDYETIVRLNEGEKSRCLSHKERRVIGLLAFLVALGLAALVSWVSE